LLEDDQKYLDSLPEVIRLLGVKIDEYHVEIEQLRAKCLEQGIIDEDDNYFDDDGEDSSVSNASKSSRPPPPPPPLPLLPPSVLTKPPVPMLPPQTNTNAHAPSSLHATARSIIVSNLGVRLDEESYLSRINPWLFDKLAGSRAELTSKRSRYPIRAL
jgi:hypothetical protein